MPIADSHKYHARIKICLAIFVLGLVISGVTAFPLESELNFLRRFVAHYAPGTALETWINRAYQGIAETNVRFPFIAYGTDWLALAHLVIAVAFWGPYKDPVRNEWTIDFGLIACLMVIPLALIAGPIRGIPVYWRLIDCSFGVLGAIPLLFCKYYLKQLRGP